MKNNKGYTLVELLVAMAIFAIIMAEIGTMMNHSSKLYLNGTYEVDLQTEAQQIVQQMEELLIDASVSVNVTPNASGLSVNNIEIVNYDSSYRIVYVQPDPSVSYGNIYLTSTGPYTADNQLMGEYVESISLNMAEYASASKITLEVLLRNDKYTYATSKDIYLRNDIGLSGNRATPSAEGEFKYELDVLRFKEYNLSQLFNTCTDGGYETKSYIYRLRADDNSHVAQNNQYIITNSGSTYYLETKDVLNNDHGAVGGDCMVDAIDPDTNSTVFTIKISTDAVKIGAAGFGLFYEYTDTSAKITSPVHVEGIYLGGADSVRWEVVAVEDSGTTSLSTSTSTTYDSGFSHRFTGDLYVRADKLSAVIRDDWNSIIFEGERMMNHDNYYTAIRNGGMFKMITTFDFPTGPDLIVNSYMYPSSADQSQAMPPDVAEIFWSNCR